MIDSQNRPLTFEELERLKYNWVFAIFFFFFDFPRNGFFDSYRNKSERN